LTWRQQTMTEFTTFGCLPLHELAPCHAKHPVLSTGWLWASMCHG
jgi:hypothetical protein